MPVIRRLQNQQGGIRNRPPNNCDKPQSFEWCRSSKSGVNFKVQIVFSFFDSTIWSIISKSLTYSIRLLLLFLKGCRTKSKHVIHSVSQVYKIDHWQMKNSYHSGKIEFACCNQNDCNSKPVSEMTIDQVKASGAEGIFENHFMFYMALGSTFICFSS